MTAELAGALRERVTLLARGEDRDGLGGAIGEWTAAGETWAAIAPAGAGPASAGDAREAAPAWRVTMRARALTVGGRIRWLGRVLEIVRVEDDPRAADRIVAVAREVRA